MSAGTELDYFAQTHKPEQTQKKKLILKSKYYAQIPLDYHASQKPKVVKNYGKTNKRGPIKLVPKDKNIYVVYILSILVETPVMVSGQWMLTTHNMHKAYVLIFGT